MFVPAQKHRAGGNVQTGGMSRGELCAHEHLGLQGARGIVDRGADLDGACGRVEIVRYEVDLAMELLVGVCRRANHDLLAGFDVPQLVLVQIDQEPEACWIGDDE